jgi:hypothetical protein
MENLIERRKICDGLLDECIEKPFIIKLGNDEFAVDAKTLNQEFTTLGDPLKSKILEKIKHRKSKMFGTIQNEDGLPIYFKIIDGQSLANKYIILCAFGEIQPSRYQIFLEGIWEWPL